jgi:hypothetical protein
VINWQASLDRSTARKPLAATLPPVCWTVARSAPEEGIDMHDHPDLRRGDPRVHDLIAAIDEAIDVGDTVQMEELSQLLYRLDPAAGAGADT